MAYKKRFISRICAQCEQPFSTSYPHKKYCSSQCARNFQKEKYHQLPYSNLSHAHIGEIGELQVAADLVKKGFLVYRALVRNMACDLIVLTPENTTYYFEVRTGKKHRDTGKILFPKKRKSYITHFAISIENTQEIHYFLVSDVLHPISFP
jgi:hypothetical protein